MNVSWFKAIAGFFLLFGLYHLAEYMIVSWNSAAGFLAFQALFFVAAWFIARWQHMSGLAAWGLEIRPHIIKELAAGVVMGLVLYGTVFIVGLQVGSEEIIGRLGLSSAVFPLGLFVFGNLFSSLSEDILTRGYVVGLLRGRMGSVALVILSASIYLLNHIYRITDGPVAWVYLFMLGITYAIPLILTGRLWYTGGMHWAGNSLFFMTHEIIKTDSAAAWISSNYILAVATVPAIIINFFIIQFLKQSKAAPSDSTAV